MTLGLAYQARNFAAILTDSADFRGPEMVPVLGSKFLSLGRFMSVISGAVPPDPPDISSYSLQSAARTLRDWCRRVPQESDPTAPFRGGPQVLITDGRRVCMILRLGPPRLLELGELVVIGNRDQRAKELGIIRNYGELSADDASALLIDVAERLTQDLYESLGCRTVGEVVAKYGAQPTVQRPFHLKVMHANQNTRTEITA